jgi:integrase
MPGSWKKRGNSITITVSDGTDIRGKQIRYYKTIPYVSDKQAEKEVSLFFAECTNGNIQRGSESTIGDLCESYLRTNIFIKPSTAEAYRSIIDNHISDISSIKASKLKKVAVQQWINGMTDVSPKTVRNIFACLSAVIKWAISMDMISSNPCQSVRLPKKESKEAKFYSDEQVKALMIKLESLTDAELKYQVAIYIALFGGLRKAEILGLNWEDYDGKSIKIRRTRMIRRGAGVYESTPKTSGSARLVSLPEQVCERINRLWDQQQEQKDFLGAMWNESDAILKGDYGTPLYPQVLQRWFTRFIEKNNLPPLTLHGLRHTHTSMLASMQLDPKQISERLGHSQMTTTMNIYTHIFHKDDGIADELSRQFLH